MSPKRQKFLTEAIPRAPSDRYLWVKERVADGRLTLAQARTVMGTRIDENEVVFLRPDGPRADAPERAKAFVRAIQDRDSMAKTEGAPALRRERHQIRRGRCRRLPLRH